MPQKKAAARKKTKVKVKTRTKTKTKPKTKPKAKTKAKVKKRTKTKAKAKADVRKKAGTGAKTAKRTGTPKKSKAKVKTTMKTQAKTQTPAKPKAAAKSKGTAGKKLGKKVLEEMRALIMAERERIIRELGRIEETINDATQGQEGSNQSYSNHLADIGTDYMEQEKNFYYASQEGHYLRSLDEALQRIDRGEYGVCEMCGELIGDLRLKAVPSARLCIKCKSESEKIQRGR